MKVIRILAAIVITSLLTACGGDEKKDTKEEKITLGSQKKKSKDDNKVNLALTGNDLMQYDKNELKVKAGQEVTFDVQEGPKGLHAENIDFPDGAER